MRAVRFYVSTRPSPPPPSSPPPSPLLLLVPLLRPCEFSVMRRTSTAIPFCSKERRFTESTFYRKGGMVRQRIRKIRSDAGKSRAKYKRQLAKPEHARLLSTASCGFSAPEEGVIVSTILDEMSPPKRSKT